MVAAVMQYWRILSRQDCSIDRGYIMTSRYFNDIDGCTVAQLAHANEIISEWIYRHLERNDSAWPREYEHARERILKSVNFL